MNDSSKLAALLRELRQRGKLPALDANVGTIYSLTTDPLTSTAELTSVILRDTALTSSVISTANCALYRPSEPVKTVSSAILIMGYETVRSLAFSLGILKQLNQNAKSRNLYRLFACSYFAGMFAMSLGQQLKRENPEELRVQGILAELPRLLLANAFPEQYAAMEERIVNGGQTLRYACLEVFGVNYDELGLAIAQQWNLPANVARCLQSDTTRDPAVGLIHRAMHLADMMFGNAAGGAAALATEEKELQTLTGNDDFKLSDFIVKSSTFDPNVSRFFKLSPEDVEMMVRIVEWGKVSAAQVATTLTYGAADEVLEPKGSEDAATIIGNYFTEMILSVRRGVELNRILLTGMEAIYRCLQPGAVILAFLDSQKKYLEGRSHLGLSSTFRPSQFRFNLSDLNSPIVRALQSRQLVRTSTRTELPLPWLKETDVDFILLVPVVVFGNAIGQCVVGRNSQQPFTEQEEAWVQAVAEHIALAFERNR